MRGNDIFDFVPRLRQYGQHVVQQEVLCLCLDARHPLISAASDGAVWMRRGRILLFIFAFGLPISVVRTQTSAAMDEYEVKAAFLYNFAKFVEWPAGAPQNSSDPFIVGVLGADPFCGVLDRVIGSKTVMGRNIVVRRFKGYQDLTYCHLLFVSNSEKADLSRVLQGIRDVSTLTVGEMEGFVDCGGMIQFIVINKRIRFSINAAATDGAGLTLSSKLLNLGVDIRKKSGNRN